METGFKVMEASEEEIPVAIAAAECQDIMEGSQYIDDNYQVITLFFHVKGNLPLR